MDHNPYREDSPIVRDGPALAAGRLSIGVFMNEKSDIFVEGELLHLTVKKNNIVIPMDHIKEFEFLNAYLFVEQGSIVIRELHYLDYHCQSQLIYRWVQKFGFFSKKIDSFLATLEHVTNKTVRIIDKNYPTIP